MHRVEPAHEVGVLLLQDLVEDAHAKEHLAHDEDVGEGEAVPDQEFPTLFWVEVVVEALAARVEAAQAVLGVLAHGLVAADQGEDHTADW